MPSDASTPRAYTQVELPTMTVAQLKALCKNQKISGYSKLGKQALIQKLVEKVQLPQQTPNARSTPLGSMTSASARWSRPQCMIREAEAEKTTSSDKSRRGAGAQTNLQVAQSSEFLSGHGSSTGYLNGQTALECPAARLQGEIPRLLGSRSTTPSHHHVRLGGDAAPNKTSGTHTSEQAQQRRARNAESTMLPPPAKRYRASSPPVGPQAPSAPERNDLRSGSCIGSSSSNLNGSLNTVIRTEDESTPRPVDGATPSVTAQRRPPRTSRKPFKLLVVDKAKLQSAKTGPGISSPQVPTAVRPIVCAHSFAILEDFVAPIPHLSNITLPPSLVQRKRIQQLAIVLSGLTNQERAACVLVSRAFRYAGMLLNPAPTLSSPPNLRLYLSVPVCIGDPRA